MLKHLVVALAGLTLAACAPAAVPTLVPTLPPVSPPANTPVPATPIAQVSPTALSASPTPEPPTATPAPVVTLEGTPLARLDAVQPLALNTLRMVDAQTGWAVAQGETDPNDHVLFTRDGGLTWRDVSPPQPLDATAQQALGQAATFAVRDAQTAWATFYDRTAAPLSAPAYVWRTSNGGEAWLPSAPLPLQDAAFYSPSDLVFVDAKTGWLLAHVDAGMMKDYVYLLGTTDGGASWQILVDPFTDKHGLPMSCGKTGLAFADARTGWLTGDCQGVAPGPPFLYQTTDGGVTWQAVTLPAPDNAPNLFADDNFACGARAPLLFKDKTGVLAVSCLDFANGADPHYLYHTADGGATWRVTGLGGAFVSGQFFDSANGVLALRDANGQHALFVTSDGGQTLTKTRDLPGPTVVNFLNPTTGWLLGNASGASGLTALVGLDARDLAPQIAP